MAETRTSLDRHSDPLGVWIVVALFAHVAAASVFVLLGIWAEDVRPKPLIDPDEVMQVAMVSLPKAERLPDKASRAPRPPPAPEPAKPQPAPEVKPPPKQSNMVHKTEEPDPKPKPAPKEPVVDNMANLLAELDKGPTPDELLDAELGTMDRSASSLTGTGDRPASHATVGKGSPEYNAYVRKLTQLFLAEFRPLGTLRDTGLKTTVFVTVSGDGSITARRVSRSSGNPSWDRAAEAAVDAVGRIPLPPESLRARMSEGYNIHFEDE